MNLTSTILDILNQSNPSAPFRDLKREAEETADLVTVIATSIATAALAMHTMKQLEGQRRRNQERQRAIKAERNRGARLQLTRQRHRKRRGFYA